MLLSWRRTRRKGNIKNDLIKSVVMKTEFDTRQAETNIFCNTNEDTEGSIKTIANWWAILFLAQRKLDTVELIRQSITVNLHKIIFNNNYLKFIRLISYLTLLSK
jgi:hypothetical protein